MPRFRGDFGFYFGAILFALFASSTAKASELSAANVMFILDSTASLNERFVRQARSIATDFNANYSAGFDGRSAGGSRGFQHFAATSKLEKATGKGTERLTDPLTAVLWQLADERHFDGVFAAIRQFSSDYLEGALDRYIVQIDAYSRHVVIYTWLRSPGAKLNSLETCMQVARLVQPISRLEPDQRSPSEYCEVNIFRAGQKQTSPWDLVAEIRRLSQEDQTADSSNEASRPTLVGAAFEIARLKAEIRDLERQKVVDAAVWEKRLNDLSEALHRANMALTEANIAMAKAMPNGDQKFSLLLTVIIALATPTFIGLGTLIAFLMYRLHRRKEDRELTVEKASATAGTPMPPTEVIEVIAIGETTYPGVRSPQKTVANAAA